MQKKAPKKSNHKPASILQAKDLTGFLVKWRHKVCIAGVNWHRFAFKLDCTVHLAENLPCKSSRQTADELTTSMQECSGLPVGRFHSYFCCCDLSGAAKCASWGNLVVCRESYQRRSPEANIGNQLTAATKYWIFIIHIVSPFFIFVPEAVAAMSLTAKSKLLQRLLKKIGQRKVVRMYEPNLVHNHILWCPTCNTFV